MIHHPWNYTTRRRTKEWKRSQQSAQRHPEWKAKMWFWRQTDTSSARWSWYLAVPPTGLTAMGTDKCRWVKCISCGNYLNSMNLHHWWDESGTKNEQQQQNIYTTGRVCLVHGTVCGCTEWYGWCCLWRIPPAIHQRCWKTKPRCKHNPSVQLPAEGYNIHPWRQFLYSSFNKTSLIKFLVG